MNPELCRNCNRHLLCVTKVRYLMLCHSRARMGSRFLSDARFLSGFYFMYISRIISYCGVLFVAGLFLIGTGCQAELPNEPVTNEAPAVERESGGGLEAAAIALQEMAEEEVEALEEQEESEQESEEDVANLEKTVDQEVTEAVETTVAPEQQQAAATTEPEEAPVVVAETQPVQAAQPAEATEPLETVEKKPVVEEQSIPIRIVVVGPSGSRLTYELQVEKNSTVEQAMKKARKNKGLAYQTREFAGMGTYVEGVNGVEESGGLYWVYYINGTRAYSGISTTTVKKNDEIMWKFRKPGAAD